MNVRMAEIAGGEARELYARRPVILLPMGSHEDQGPHAPMGDYLSAARMAELIAERATRDGVETVVAPVVPFGGADYFGSMPGGIALEQATLRAVITDMFNCLLRHKLNRLIVINGHLGNVQAINDVTQELYRKQQVLIPSFYLWRVGYGLLIKHLGAEKAKEVSGHGADPLTSVVMHLFPELVRKDLVPGPQKRGSFFDLPITGGVTVAFDGAEIAMPMEMGTSAPIGVSSGDPRQCSAETGKMLVEQLTDLGARFVKHYAERVR